MYYVQIQLEENPRDAIAQSLFFKHILNSYKTNSLYHYFSNIFQTVKKLKVCVDFKFSRSLFSLRFKMSPSRELGEKASFVFILIFPFDNSLIIITSLHYAAASKSIPLYLVLQHAFDNSFIIIPLLNSNSLHLIKFTFNNISI